MSNIDHVQKYRDCAARGLSQADTARELGVSREAVRLMTNRHGIKFPPTPRQVSAERAAIVAAATDLTLGQVANILGVTRNTVCRLTPAELKHKRPRKPKPAPRAEQIASLAAQGLTAGEVAQRLGVPQSSVSRAKKQYGIVFLCDGRARS
jgi:DNA-binding CsgD family transcriptional regulator